MIECSKAIKTPSIGLFLAGMKIVQQYLSNTENLLELIDYNYELKDQFQSVFGKYFRLNSQVKKKKKTTTPHTETNINLMKEITCIFYFNYLENNRRCFRKSSTICSQTST
jgi:hypothetical protein